MAKNKRRSSPSFLKSQLWSNNVSPLESLEKRAMLAAHIVGNSTSYATIQAAVNAAAPGAVINVDAGTYAETVTISKTLTLRGAQAGVDGRGARGPESIIYNTPTDIKILANDVTIDGFTIQGYKTNVGAALAAGVYMGPSIHGTHVVNNIIQNNVTGLYLSNNSNTDAAVIQRNYFFNNTETGSDWTYGWNGSRAIYTDGEVSGGMLTNVTIDNNKFYRSDTYTGEGLIALAAQTAGKQFNITITNNSFSAVNGYSSKAVLVFNTTNLTVIGNTITAQNDSSSGPLRFEGNANTVNIQYNSIFNNPGPGVAVDSAGVAGDSSGFVINNNNIYGNTIGVLTIASVYDGTVIAVNDWWGSASGPSGLGPGTGQQVWANGVSGHYTTPKGAPGGSMIFTPWATSMINIANIPVPAAGTGLKATSYSPTQIQLSWTPQMSTAFSQMIQRSTDGVNFTTVATVPPLLNNYIDSGITSGVTYTYRVIASNATGNSAPSNTASAMAAPSAPPVPPTGVVATSTTSNSVVLQWSAPSYSIGVTGYTIYRNGVAVGTSATTTFTDTGLTSSTAYSYAVATNDSTGAISAKSASATATTKAVQFADASFENNTITTYAYNPVNANWTFNAKSGIEANGSTWAAANAPNGTHAAFIQGSGNVNGTISQTLNTSVAGSYTISFSAAQRTGYGVEPIAVSVDGTVITTISPTSSAFATFTTPTFALAAGNHVFKFAGTNGVGDNDTFIDAISLNLGASSTPPSAPAGLSASALSSSQIKLSWQPAGVAPTSFTLQRSTDNILFTNVTTAIAGAATTYTDATGLAAGTTYYYRLVAVNAVGSSPASNTASAMTLSASAIVKPLSSIPWTSATAGWKTPQLNTSINGTTLTLRGKTYASGIGTHAVSNITYNLGGNYTLFQSDVGIDDEVATTGTGAVKFQVFGDGVLLYDSGVLTRSSAAASINISVAGVQTLTLVATNGVNGSIDFDHADWAGAQLLQNPQAPAAPSGVTATAVSTTSIKFAWTSTGTGLTGFKVDRSLDGTTWSTIATVGASVFSYTDTGLTAATNYSYRVRAVNSVGESPNSAVASAKTLAATSVTTNLSSLNWVSATAGYGTVQKDTTIKGNTITLRGTTYTTGIGTHASSQIVYNLAGGYTNFLSDIGVDDEVNGIGTGTVVFQVIADGKVVYDSGPLTNASPTVSININVTGVQTLTLVANAINGDIDFAHADWAGAKLLSNPVLG